MATQLIVKGAATQKRISTSCWSSMILMTLSNSSYETLGFTVAWGARVVASAFCLSCGKRSPATFWYAVAALTASTIATTTTTKTRDSKNCSEKLSKTQKILSAYLLLLECLRPAYVQLVCPAPASLTLLAFLFVLSASCNIQILSWDWLNQISAIEVSVTLVFVRVWLRQHQFRKQCIRLRLGHLWSLDRSL